MQSTTAEIYCECVETPVVSVQARTHVTRGSVLLKLEAYNPAGSIKYRTAVGLVDELARSGPLGPGTTVVESTSGNLGVALAELLARIDCHFIAVIDPRTPRPARTAINKTGADVLVVDELDESGGYLLTRLRMVHELLAANPDYRWTDQYGSAANPRIHEQTTGPEISRQGGDRLSAVYAPVSTGGTLAGVANFLRTNRPAVRITAVDAQNSLVTGTRAGPRLITGIGANRTSSFLERHHYDNSVAISDAEAFAVCRLLLADTGLCVGGSSGSSLAAWVRTLLSAGGPPELALCVCPDGGDRYLHTFYDDGWLTRNRLLADVRAAVAWLRDAGLRFTGVAP